MTRLQTYGINKISFSACLAELRETSVRKGTTATVNSSSSKKMKAPHPQ